MRNIFKVAFASLAFSIFAFNSVACNDCDSYRDGRKFYLGIEGGISSALKKEFTHQKTKMKGSLKSSLLYGALIGYKFYPGMAIEGSWQHKPSYKMKFILPKVTIGGIELSKTLGKTRIISDIYLVGLIYDFPETAEFTPYIGLDAGIARISSKKTSVYKDIPTPLGIVNKEIFRVKDASTISPAMQITLGIASGEILPNLRVNLSGRIQVIKDGTIKYEKFDVMTGGWSGAKLKQTLGVGEIIFGMTYDLF